VPGSSLKSNFTALFWKWRIVDNNDGDDDDDDFEKDGFEKDF
jgi:hypothetical protein